MSRSATAGNVRPHRRGASLPSLDGGDGKNRTSLKKAGISFLCSGRFTHDYVLHKSIYDFLLRITAV